MDRFDDIWKNRFNEKQGPSQDWTLPDDAVWNNVAAEIGAAKKRRFGFFWLPWIGGVVLAFGLSVYLLGSEKGLKLNEADRISNNQNFTKSNTEINYAKASNATEKPMSNMVENLVPPTIKTKEALVKKEESRSVSHNSREEAKVKNLPRSQKTANFIRTEDLNFDQRTFTQVPSSKTKSFVSDEKSSSNLYEAEAISVISEPFKKDQNSEEKNAFKPSALIPIVAIESFDEKEVNLKIKETQDFVLNTDYNGWSLIADAGVVFWQNKISDQYQSDLSPFDFDYTDEFGYVASINLQKEITRKFSVGVGLSYERITNNSGHNSILNYSRSSEDVPAHNNYELSLATPYGLSQANFLLFRNTEITEEDLELLVDFRSSHTIQNLSLPLIANYDLIRNRKLDIGLLLGFGFNYLLGIENEIASIDTNHGAIEHVVGTDDKFLSPDVNKWHYDVRAGINFQYAFNFKTKMSLNYNFIQGLNPIYKVDNYNTRINRHQLTLGLKKYIF